MASSAVGSVTSGMELLNIHPSASKPSLISSFWSLHVQLPNNPEASELDLRCSSQNSLPDVAQQAMAVEKIIEVGRSKSLSDLRCSVPDASLFHRETELPSARAHEDSAERQRRISFSVQEWLRHIDAPQVTSATA